MKKTRMLCKVGKWLIVLILGVLLFIALLMIRSANWFLGTFGEMDFSIVIYQLFSPLKGTATDILSEYKNVVFVRTVGIVALVMLIYVFCDIVFNKCYINICFQIRNLKLKLSFDRKIYSICKWCVLIVGTLVLLFELWNKAIAVGLPKYWDEISNSSTIFEKEYVDPKATKILFPDRKRNLILIYLESMESTYASVSDGGAKPVNYIPELTTLANENLFFSDGEKLGGGHVYTEGWTMAGLLGSSTGVPYKLPIEGNSAGEYETFLPGVTGLGDILKNVGYDNYFMCGSDAAFGGREAFYTQHGDYEILDYHRAIDDGFIPADYQVYWGMEDEKLYEYAKEKLGEIIDKGQPFNFSMLTVDTHHPDGYTCVLCGNQYPEKYANAIACGSRQAADFVKWIQQQDWYENTTVVLIGDHISMNNNFWDDIGDYERTIYNCFINLPDGIDTSNMKNREYSTLDMYPTILTAIGGNIEGNRLGLGVNLFSGEETLPERMGKKEYLSEICKYSNYYFNNFVSK